MKKLDSILPEMQPVSPVSRKKIIPSLEQVGRLSQDLPPPMSFEGDRYRVELQSPGSPPVEIEFRKVKFNSREGKFYRWVYEGKVLVK